MHRACLAGVVAIAIGAAALAAEPPTEAAYARDLQTWLSQKLQADFRRHGKRDAPWAGRLCEFYEALTLALRSEPDPVRIETLEAAADALRAAGCDDPVFLCCQARFTTPAARAAEARETLLAQLPALRAAGYPPFYIFMNISWTLRVLTDLHAARDLYAQLYEAVILAAGDPDFAGRHKQKYVRMLLLDHTKLLAAAVPRFAAADSGVDPWITAIASGRLAINQAWKARGGGYANEVTPEGWKQFGEQLALARRHLTEAHELHPEFPEAATDMIPVCVGDGSGEERKWFDRAVAAEFDHMEAYKRYGLNALLPRWRGSHEQMIEFGRECLASGRFDTAVPGMLHRVLLFVGGERATEVREVLAMPGLYDDCLRVCEGYVKADLPAARQRLWRSRLAVLQWAAGRYAEACATLDALQDQLAPEALAEVREKIENVAGESRLFAGPHADAVAEAEDCVADNDIAAAVAGYEAVAKQGDLAPTARGMIVDRLATLKMVQAAAAGEWVDLQPTPSLAGWRPINGDWRVDADGTLVGTTSATGQLKLMCDVEFGDDVECTAEFDVTEAPQIDQPWARLAVVLAHPQNDGADRGGLCVRLVGPGRRLFVSAGLGGNQFLAVAVPPLKAKNALRLVLWDGKLSAFVNGEKVVDKAAVPAEALAGGGLALTDFDPGRQLAVRGRGLRARRLEEKPDDF